MKKKIPYVFSVLCLGLLCHAPANGGGPMNPTWPAALLPDGLDQGDCCELVDLTLPKFDEFFEGPGKDRYICYADCAVDQVFQTSVHFEVPEGKRGDSRTESPLPLDPSLVNTRHACEDSFSRRDLMQPGWMLNPG